jgi:hypothetical protein
MTTPAGNKAITMPIRQPLSLSFNYNYLPLTEPLLINLEFQSETLTLAIIAG